MEGLDVGRVPLVRGVTTVGDFTSQQTTVSSCGPLCWRDLCPPLFTADARAVPATGAGGRTHRYGVNTKHQSMPLSETMTRSWRWVYHVLCIQYASGTMHFHRFCYSMCWHEGGRKKVLEKQSQQVPRREALT
jgi:hypothetical protein